MEDMLMDTRDLKIGSKGESFFSSISALTLFHEEAFVYDAQTGKRIGVRDLRSKKKEGEFALPDGSLIELKTDTRCYDTGNIIVELSGRNGDVGWFQHCRSNGVKYLVWHLYRGETKLYPYLCVRFDFNTFDAYIKELTSSEAYMKKNCRTKKDNDGAAFTIMIVNLEDAIQHCKPLIAITQKNEEDLLSVLQESLNRIFSDVSVHVNGQLDPKECVIQYSHE